MISNHDRDLISKADVAVFGLNRALIASADPQLAEEFGLSVDKRDGLMLTSAARIPHPFVNNIAELGIHTAVTREQVDALVAEHPAKMIIVAPFALPAELPDWLRELGYDDVARGTYHQYVGDPIKTPETTLRIEKLAVGDGMDFAMVATQVGMLSEFAHVAGVAPERFSSWFASLVRQQGCHVYVAYDGDAPVATGMFYAENQTAWFAFAATLPAHRGRGAQSALIARRVQDALDLGCREIFVGTGASKADAAAKAHHTSQNNLLQLGFRKLATGQFWMRMPPG